jgi:chromosome partitioning protein
MKVVALYSMKGGVGKTTCAVNLAFLAAQEGYPTLLWDLEPQGASSFYFRIKAKLKGGCEALIGGKHGLGSFIKGSDFVYLDILPADFSCRNLDLLLEEYKKPARRLSKLLEPLHGQYAYIFLDCPPSGSLLAEALMEVADAVLVPLPLTPLSAENLLRHKKLMHGHGFDPRRLFPFMSMFDRRKALHRSLETQLREQFPELLETVIPYAAVVEHMAAERLPLGAFAEHTAVAGEYVKLWREIKQRLGELSL